MGDVVEAFQQDIGVKVSTPAQAPVRTVPDSAPLL